MRVCFSIVAINCWYCLALLLFPVFISIYYNSHKALADVVGKGNEKNYAIKK